MLKRILKIVGGIVAVLVLAGVSLFGLMQLGVDVSPVFNFIGSTQDKAKRPSPAATASGQIGSASITINYGQPAKNGREVFGKLVPFGEVWRTGANEATEISLDKDILLAGQRLKAGRYQLFTIPRADKWTIIINSKLGQWGAFFHDTKSDVLRVDVPANSTETERERLNIFIETTPPQTGFTIAWDKTQVFVPIAVQ